MTQSRGISIISSTYNFLTVSTFNNYLTSCCTCCRNHFCSCIAMWTCNIRRHDFCHNHISILWRSRNVWSLIWTNILCTISSGITSCIKGVLIQISRTRIIFYCYYFCLSFKSTITITEINIILRTWCINVIDISITTTIFYNKFNCLTYISSKTALTTINRTVPIICGSIYSSLKMILTCTNRNFITTNWTNTIYIVVSECFSFITNIGITTICTSISSISAFITSRIGYYWFIIVITKCNVICFTTCWNCCFCVY